MFGYKFILERIWSGCRLLPKANIIVYEFKSNEPDFDIKFLPVYPNNSFKNYCYRLRPRIIKSPQ